MVSVPTFDGSIKSLTAESIGNALEHDGCSILDRVVHRYVGGYDVARARNFMAQWALDEGVDYLLMVDSDMVLPKDAIANLLSHDVEICTGWAVKGSSDYGLTSVVKFGPNSFNDCYYADEIDMMACDYRLHGIKSPLLDVKGNGMCCALISTDVFRRFKRPWFKFVDNANGSGLGEDYWFCMQCANLGMKVHVDTRVGCGHIHDRILEAR